MHNYASPPSVTGEVYCFPRRQLIFSFGRGIIYHLDTCRNWFRLSVCTTIFKWIGGLCFYPKYLMLYIIGFFFYELYKLMEFFLKYRICFWIFDRKPNFFQTNREAWLWIKVQCVVYQWISLNKLYKLIEGSFSNSSMNY